MANEPAWYESFFGQDYLDVYGHEFSEERAERETQFAVRTLGLQPGETVLDLCCGPGRHSVRLAALGLQVTSLDLSWQYLELTRSLAHERGVELETSHADMRAIPYEDRFDAVVNMFSSFGYLESEDEDARVLAAVHRALKPGGSLLLDLINREWVVRNYIQNDWHEGRDGTLYLEHRELDLAASRNHVTFSAVTPEGIRREIIGHHIRLYTLRELRGMLEAAGLSYEAAYGGFDGQAYAVDTRRMMVVARKP